MRLFLFAAAVLLCGIAHGQIKITPAQPLANRPIVLSVDVPTEAGWESLYDWEIDGASWLPADDQTRMDARLSTIHVWGDPGTYKAKLSVDSINWEQRKRSRRKFDLEFSIPGKAQPEPDPQPQPDPTPGPVSVPFCVVVEESNARPADPGIIGILAGTAIQKLYEARGWKAPDGGIAFARIDKDAKLGMMDSGRAAWVKSAIAAATSSSKTLPVLVWSAAMDAKPTVEALQPNEAAQMARIEAIAKGSK